jgi:ectoine hydroxylase-related dioxygenase (phytanoyl-CoA dioxygenase family)
MSFDLTKFKQDIAVDGYSIVENVFSAPFMDRAKIELESAIGAEASFHGSTDYTDYGMVLLCALYGGIFIEIFDEQKFTEPVETILGEGSIVYGYTSSSMPPKATNYSSRIHVDCPRLIPDYLTNFGAFIAVSDISEENGAMHYLPASHNDAKEPTADYFEKNCQRAVLEKGAVFFFSPRLWHRGGVNPSNDWRHAITINFCRPYMKQRIDIPRALSHMESSDWSEKVKQKLGFYAQTPISYEEYYVPPEKRKFRQKYE